MNIVYTFIIGVWFFGAAVVFFDRVKRSTGRRCACHATRIPHGDIACFTRPKFLTVVHERHRCYPIREMITR